MPDKGIVQKRPTVPPRVHPAFTLALALVAVPILVLFGFGFMNDEGVPWRVVIVLTYLSGAWLAPIVLAWRLVRQGVHLSDAVAAAIGASVAVLAVDLGLLTIELPAAQLLMLLLLGAAIPLTISVWVGARRMRVPPRPDIPS
jgi:hypothetical protein